MKHLTEYTLCELSRMLWEGSCTSVALTEACLEQIDRQEPTVGAFLTVCRESALLAARESDARRARGEARGMLDGIPYAVKDNYCTNGVRTTAASRMLADFVPSYDATVVSKLEEAGCVLLGKLNMDEFAMGSTTETSALGVTRNPRNLDYVAGGSSGGSAAAVAACEVPFSIGSDTGGSVRQPAAFCGTVGLKPTYGVVSRYGLIAMASSLDCVGILAKTAEDTALVLEALVGVDGLDATVRSHPNSTLGTVLPPNRPLRVGVVSELLDGETVEASVIGAVESALRDLVRAGATVEPVSLPSPEEALAAYCVISAAEASSNLSRFDGVRYGHRDADASDLFSMYAESRASGFGSEVKRRILFGAYMLSEHNRPLYYDAAIRARQMIREELTQTLTRCDLILTPTTPTSAFLRGSKMSAAQKRRADLCAVYASLAGVPAISIPYGYAENGLPLAVQLIAAPYAENLLFYAAGLIEKGDGANDKYGI